jgi:hypothetical protein
MLGRLRGAIVVVYLRYAMTKVNAMHSDGAGRIRRRYGRNTRYVRCAFIADCTVCSLPTRDVSASCEAALHQLSRREPALPAGTRKDRFRRLTASRSGPPWAGGGQYKRRFFGPATHPGIRPADGSATAAPRVSGVKGHPGPFGRLAAGSQTVMMMRGVTTLGQRLPASSGCPPGAFVDRRSRATCAGCQSCLQRALCDGTRSRR